MGSAARVRKLIEQIDRADGRTGLPAFSRRVTNTEEEFLRAAYRKSGTKVYRDGWPDFLLVRDGKSFGVEIKRNAKDQLRASQVTTFIELETVGLPVFVWSPDNASVLVPWRKFDGRSQEELRLVHDSSQLPALKPRSR